jgi:hypothetical protein
MMGYIERNPSLVQTLSHNVKMCTVVVGRRDDDQGACGA